MPIVHQIRNSVRHIPSKEYKRFTAHLKKICGAPSLAAAEAEFERFRAAWSAYPKNFTKLPVFSLTCLRILVMIFS